MAKGQYRYIYEGYPGVITLDTLQGPALAEYLSTHYDTGEREPLLGWPDKQVEVWEGQWGDKDYIGALRQRGTGRGKS